MLPHSATNSVCCGELIQLQASKFQSQVAEKWRGIFQYYFHAVPKIFYSLQVTGSSDAAQMPKVGWRQRADVFSFNLETKSAAL